MPEALKTLQRTLERVGDSAATVSTSVNAGLPLPPVPPGSTQRGRATQRATLESIDAGGADLSMPPDTLDREFIEGVLD